MRRFHRRRAKVGEFAHPFGAKRRPFVSGRVSRANPSAAPCLPRKVPNEAMVSTHKTLVVSNEGRVSTHKTPAVLNDVMVSIHKSPIMPNEGMALCLLVFGE